jgi:hypothetical protein
MRWDRYSWAEWLPAASIFSRATALNVSALMVSGNDSSPSPSTCAQRMWNMIVFDDKIDDQFATALRQATMPAGQSLNSLGGLGNDHQTETHR